MILTGKNAALETRLARRWLTRGHTHPLYISLAAQFDVGPAHPVLELLVSCIHRWREIAFLLTPSVFKMILKLSDPFPLLEVAAVEMGGFPDTFTQVVDVFSHAPRLYSMSCVGVFPPCKFLLPWKQLTYYSSPHLTISELLEILPLASEINEAKLHIGGQADSWPAEILIPICLPRLETLSIVTEVPPKLLFDPLTLPSLHTISVRDDYRILQTRRDSSSLNGALGLLVQRSACELRSITLYAVLTEEELIELLTCTPQLTEFRLSGQGVSCITSSVLSSLTIQEPDPEGGFSCLVPKLQILALWRYNTLDDDAFWRMVLSRCQIHPVSPGRRRLKSLDLHSRGGTAAWQVDILARIQECKELGLQLEGHRLLL